MTHVSIVILHYNTPTETHRCLRSLRNIKFPAGEYDIIVVDNASREPFECVKSELEQGVQVIRSESNLGFSGGNNLGIQYAIEQFNSEYVCLLNSDTRVSESFLQQLVVFLEENAKVGAVCPLIYFEKGFEFHADSYRSAELGQVVWFGGGCIDWRNLHAFHAHVDEVDRGQVEDQVDMDFATGCCVLLRREVLEKTNGFDDRYFLYLEDVDLSIRIQQAGYSLGLSRSSVIWHANAGSSGGAGSQMHRYYQTRNRLLFFWMYATWRQRVTIIRWMLHIGLTGKTVERKALAHAILNQYGKETVI